MAKGYIPPSNYGIPFRFSQTGYQSPDWNAISFAFTSKHESIGNLRAAINVLAAEPDNYQQTTYTYLKYCEEYIIGYNQYGVQILKGKCYYGGIRDLGIFAEGIEKIVYSGIKNLFIRIRGVYSETKDLSLVMSGELPANLKAYLKVFQTDYVDLPVNIHGWVERYLDIYIKGLTYNSLPIFIESVPSIDLPIYLNVWPMKCLSINIYGWDQRDLSAYLYAVQQSNLPIDIASEPAKDLNIILKGWVREAYSNLGAYITGFKYNDLPIIIRAKYLANLLMYVYGIPSQNLSMFIHGFDKLDLPIILNGVRGNYDLLAIINGTSNYKELSVYIKGMLGTDIPSNLRIYIGGKYASNLTASIFGINAINLPIYLNCFGQTANLPIFIYPETIRLSSIVSVITMEHLDLSVVINPSCIWSGFKNLNIYIRSVYMTDLNAVIVGKRNNATHRNLGIKVGYMDTYSFIDKFPVNVTVSTSSYKFIDKLPIYLKVFKESVILSTYINGIYRTEDLPVYIYGRHLNPHYFANVKNKQEVCKLTHSGEIEWFEMVELAFKSIVNDYYYSESGNTAWKTDRLDKWILDARSYIPMNVKLGTKRRLHRLKYMYDLSDFRSIDEAIKYAIDFVTDYPEINLSAHINPSGGWINLQSRINARRIVQEYNNLNFDITGIGFKDVVVGTDEGIEII